MHQLCFHKRGRTYQNLFNKKIKETSHYNQHVEVIPKIFEVILNSKVKIIMSPLNI